ncbi:MAG: hypothetical protein WCF23_05770 [Candidatus Nitrosopolaris sp.]
MLNYISMMLLAASATKISQSNNYPTTGMLVRINCHSINKREV